jgi:hypothetical protein
LIIYACPGDLKAPSGQAIITTENREKNILIIYAPLWPLGQGRIIKICSLG